VHSLLAFFRRHSAIRERKLDILEYREIPDEIERLENESDLTVPDARAICGRQIRNSLTRQHVLTTTWCIQQAQYREQCCLS